MARKSENLTPGPPSKPVGSALSILDWDEGSPSASGWFGVAIRYAPGAASQRRNDSRARLELPLEDSRSSPKGIAT
jgi:hypothetical protein